MPYDGTYSRSGVNSAPTLDAWKLKTSQVALSLVLLCVKHRLWFRHEKFRKGESEAKARGGI